MEVEGGSGAAVGVGPGTSVETGVEVGLGALVGVGLWVAEGVGAVAVAVEAGVGDGSWVGAALEQPAIIKKSRARMSVAFQEYVESLSYKLLHHINGSMVTQWVSRKPYS